MVVPAGEPRRAPDRAVLRRIGDHVPPGGGRVRLPARGVAQGIVAPRDARMGPGDDGYRHDGDGGLAFAGYASLFIPLPLWIVAVALVVAMAALNVLGCQRGELGQHRLHARRVGWPRRPHRRRCTRSRFWAYLHDSAPCRCSWRRGPHLLRLPWLRGDRQPRRGGDASRAGPAARHPDRGRRLDHALYPRGGGERYPVGTSTARGERITAGGCDAGRGTAPRWRAGGRRAVRHGEYGTDRHDGREPPPLCHGTWQ